MDKKDKKIIYLNINQEDKEKTSEQQRNEKAQMEYLRTKKKNKIIDKRKKQKEKAIIFNISQRAVAFTITVLMIIVAMLLIENRDKVNVDYLRRVIKYSSISRDKSGQSEEFTFTYDPDNCYASVDGKLFVCSKNLLQIIGVNGEKIENKTVSMSSPIIRTNNNYAVIYDAGGSELYIYNGIEEKFDYTSQESNRIISARINQNGYLALVEQTAGHKASVSVYNSQFKLLLTIDKTDTFVSDAIISPNNNLTGLIELSQDGSDFVNSFAIYQNSDATQKSTTVVKSDMIIDLKWSNPSYVWMQLENGIDIVNSLGEIENTWESADKYLERYAISNDDFAVETLSKYRSGGSEELHIIKSTGQQSVSRNIDDEILNISVNNGYIAVLTTKSLTIYRSNLEEYAQVANSSFKSVIVNSDGSAIAIGNGTARIFVP